jgi:uncharacterized protein YceK
MSNKFHSVVFVAWALLLSGCASIVNGTNQSVSVHNGPITGSICTLENNKGRWYIPHTPGSVTVHRSFGDLIVQCRKPGYTLGITHVKSKTKAMAFGNLVFGGAIGAGVDMVDGAAYDYPEDIYVPMRKG